MLSFSGYYFRINCFRLHLWSVFNRNFNRDMKKRKLAVKCLLFYFFKLFLFFFKPRSRCWRFRKHFSTVTGPVFSALVCWEKSNLGKGNQENRHGEEKKPLIGYGFSHRFYPKPHTNALNHISIIFFK